MLAETELLALCARPHVDNAVASRVRTLLGRGLDWERCLRLADRHGVTALLHRGLVAASWGGGSAAAVPAGVRSSLGERVVANGRRNLALARELVLLLEALEQEGIGAIAFKGPTLALQAYGDLALRQFGDLDILVNGADVPKAQAVLVRRGYRGVPDLTPAQEVAFRESANHMRLVHADGYRQVELHWALTPPKFACALDAAEFASRLRPVLVGGRTVRTFAPEDLVFYLCVHGCGHVWERLAWVADIAALIERERGMDWPAIAARARAVGAARMLRLGLWLAHELLAAPLPPELASSCATDRTAHALAAEAGRCLLDGRESVPSIWERLFLNVRMRERLGDRVRLCYRQLAMPTPADWALLPPHLGPRSPLVYAIRPVRLLLRHGPALLRARSRTP